MNQDQQKYPELRVGIAGCGNVAEHHARFLKLVSGVKLAGVADVSQESARRFAQKHGVACVSNSVEGLLDSTQIDVLHVTTPPQYHYAAARVALDRGVHVFLEKPMAFTAQEVTDLYQRATSRTRLCPDFINLFHPRMQQAIQKIESGALGRVVHVEAQMCLNLEDELRESEGLHWTYRLPGGLLRDYTSHILYLALYFTGSLKDMQMVRKASGRLPQGLVDHLTVQMDGQRCTASVLLSCLSKQSAYRVRIHCENGLAEVDFETQTALVNARSALPRRVTQGLGVFVNGAKESWQATANIVNYLRGKVVPYAGLRVLLPRFYQGIRTGGAMPISQELATDVALAEERLFSGAMPEVSGEGCYSPSKQRDVRRKERVVVTGANGYVGLQVVKALVADGNWVRALVRPTSSTKELRQLGVEIFLGDIRRFADVNAAFADMNLAVHLAAGLHGSTQSIVDSSVRGTENVARAANLNHLRRVVYISSLSVYDYTRLRNGQDVGPDSPLEEDPESRGAYSLGKRRAEDVALAHLSEKAPAWTILRPSLIVGNERDILAPVGPRVGNTVVCMSSKRRKLALVHVMDVAAAILEILHTESTEGRVYTLSDPHAITVAEYVRDCVKHSPHKNVRVLYVPYFVTMTAMLLAQAVKIITGIGPHVSKRRLLSVYRSVGANSQLLQQHTGWHVPGNLIARLTHEAQTRS